MYANCHITEISVKTNTFAEECKRRTEHIDITFYNRFIVVPNKGAPCDTHCNICECD